MDPDASLRAVIRAFYGAHGGRQRPLQEAVLKALAPSQDGVLIAPTGSGKTEAALTPIARRLLEDDRGTQALRVLIISPTRALARDLHRRMSGVFAELSLRMDVSTSDVDTRGREPSDVLIRTPEGVDSDLCSKPDSLRHVGDVVIDEVHQYLTSPRGTQLAGIMWRLGVLAPAHRRIGVSATIDEPRNVEGCRIVRSPVIFRDDEGAARPDLVFHDWLGSDERAADSLLRKLSELGCRKVIAFARSKSKVEGLAKLLDRSQFRGKTLVHHANLSPAQRTQMEERLRTSPTALVVCTSTLEVGIDIGDVDTCMLFDPPPSCLSFTQRIGRAGRRSGRPRVVCVCGLGGTRLDYARCSLMPVSRAAADCRPFLSAFIQQLLSIAWQHGGLAVSDLLSFSMEAFGITDDVAGRIANRLAEDGYLKAEEHAYGVGPSLETIVSQRLLHVTFAGNSGARIVDEVTHRSIGVAPIAPGQSIVLAGKGRRYVRYDPVSGAVHVLASEDGTPSFLPARQSIFGVLAERYGLAVRRWFRPGSG